MKVGRVLVTSVVLLVLLAVFGYGVWWGYAQVSAPGPTPTPTACVPTNVGAKLTPNKVTVRVLNGGTVGGLARSTNRYLQAFGFNVITVGNTSARIATTTVVGNSATSPEVKLVMGFFPGAKAQGDGRVDHTVDVLLGAAYNQLSKPPTSVPVSGPVCLPPLSTPSSSPTPTPTPSPSPTATK